MAFAQVLWGKHCDDVLKGVRLPLAFTTTRGSFTYLDALKVSSVNMVMSLVDRGKPITRAKN